MTQLSCKISENEITIKLGIQKNLFVKNSTSGIEG